MTAILGLSAFYHDSAAALVVDGRIVAAAQEERFSRKKHDAGFPTQAIRYCLREGGLEPRDLDYVGFYEKPLRKFERLLDTYLAYAPRGFSAFARAMPSWLKEKLYIPRQIRRGLDWRYSRRIVFLEHHQSHAASAFFPSPFEEAAILTADGVGEWATASIGMGSGNRIELLHELRFPDSPGLLYSAFTAYCGFHVNSGEYKLMGLAPYGEPKYAELILNRLLDLKADGSFRLNLAYFKYCRGLTMTSSRFHRLFGGPPRRPESPISPRVMDLAASIQQVVEIILLRMARFAHDQTGAKNLVLAGGVALNCVANGRILREGPFERIWMQPAAGDAGGALGVALFIWRQLLNQPRLPVIGDLQFGSRLGPAFTAAEIEETLRQLGARYTFYHDDRLLYDATAELLAQGKVVGWFQGRLEFGPRALGSRSILADPRRADMQATLNRKIKHRESFRPFASAVLMERASEHFQLAPNQESPYMLLTVMVNSHRPEAPRDQPSGKDTVWRPRVNSAIPAVTHVDGSSRVQTVDAQRDPRLHSLLVKFHEKTGCPVLVNTSFNVRGEPLVGTPADAYRCFLATEMDALAIGSFLLVKDDQPARDEKMRDAYLAQFALD